MSYLIRVYLSPSVVKKLSFASWRFCDFALNFFLTSDIRFRTVHMIEKTTFVWARPEMNVTFRAEIMPGVPRENRTYRIEEVLPNGRVKLYDFAGEYRETAFEALNFLRNKASQVKK